MRASYLSLTKLQYIQRINIPSDVPYQLIKPIMSKKDQIKPSLRPFQFFQKVQKNLKDLQVTKDEKSLGKNEVPNMPDEDIGFQQEQAGDDENIPSCMKRDQSKGILLRRDNSKIVIKNQNLQDILDCQKTRKKSRKQLFIKTQGLKIDPEDQKFIIEDSPIIQPLPPHIEKPPTLTKFHQFDTFKKLNQKPMEYQQGQKMPKHQNQALGVDQEDLEQEQQLDIQEEEMMEYEEEEQSMKVHQCGTQDSTIEFQKDLEEEDLEEEEEQGIYPPLPPYQESMIEFDVNQKIDLEKVHKRHKSKTDSVHYVTSPRLLKILNAQSNMQISSNDDDLGLEEKGEKCESSQISKNLPLPLPPLPKCKEQTLHQRNQKEKQLTELDHLKKQLQENDLTIQKLKQEKLSALKHIENQKMEFQIKNKALNDLIQLSEQRVSIMEKKHSKHFQSKKQSTFRENLAQQQQTKRKLSMTGNDNSWKDLNTKDMDILNQNPFKNLEQYQQSLSIGFLEFKKKQQNFFEEILSMETKLQDLKSINESTLKNVKKREQIQLAQCYQFAERQKEELLVQLDKALDERDEIQEQFEQLQEQHFQLQQKLQEHQTNEKNKVLGKEVVKDYIETIQHLEQSNKQLLKNLDLIKKKDSMIYTEYVDQLETDKKQLEKDNSLLQNSLVLKDTEIQVLKRQSEKISVDFENLQKQSKVQEQVEIFQQPLSEQQSKDSLVKSFQSIQRESYKEEEEEEVEENGQQLAIVNLEDKIHQLQCENEQYKEELELKIQYSLSLEKEELEYQEKLSKVQEQVEILQQKNQNIQKELSLKNSTISKLQTQISKLLQKNRVSSSLSQISIISTPQKHQPYNIQSQRGPPPQTSQIINKSATKSAKMSFSQQKLYQSDYHHPSSSQISNNKVQIALQKQSIQYIKAKQQINDLMQKNINLLEENRLLKNSNKTSNISGHRESYQRFQNKHQKIQLKGVQQQKQSQQTPQSQRRGVKKKKHLIFTTQNVSSSQGGKNIANSMTTILNQSAFLKQRNSMDVMTKSLKIPRYKKLLQKHLTKYKVNEYMQQIPSQAQTTSNKQYKVNKKYLSFKAQKI